MKVSATSASAPSVLRSNFGTSRLSLLPTAASAAFAPRAEGRASQAGTIAVRLNGPAGLGDTPAILGGIREAADLHDWRVLLLSSCEDLRIEDDPLVRYGVMGLITLPSPAGVSVPWTSAIPTIVLGGQEEPLAPHSAAIALPNDTIEIALSHLWALGHRRIALITSASTQHSHNEASRFVRWFEAQGVGTADSLILRTGRGRGAIHGGSADPLPLADQLIAWRREQGVTGVVCVNAEIAPVLLAGAGIAGLSVPRDLSIVGMDSESAALARLPVGLTCVEVPARALGRDAVRLMADLLTPERRDDVSGRNHALTTPSRLISRQTTDRAPFTLSHSLRS